MDLTIRSATPSDAAAIADLMAAAEAVDDTGEHYDADAMAEELENPLVDISRDWVLAAHDGSLAASAALHPRAVVDGTVDVHLDGVVHPDHRGRGIGTSMLEKLLDRAPQYAAERDATLVLRGACRSDDVAASDLLESHGFVPHRWQFVMEADLSRPAAPVPALPEGYRLETWEGVSDDEIREAHNRAFGGFHPGFTPWDRPMWEQHVSGSRSYRPAVSLLLRDGSGAIAAYLQTAEFEAVLEATGKREAWVGKLGTTPDHRRLGLGGTLLAEGLVRYRAEGYDVAGLDVDSENPSGALGIYERAGFLVTRTFTLFEHARRM